MNELSPEQRAVVASPLVPLCVIACAGSGKTLTAVHRLAELRHRIGDHRGYVSLLSFSNVAVNTFNASYATLAKRVGYSATAHRVRIETFDSFITSNILRPHAHRTMNCKMTPFLITGAESFLQNKEYRFWVESKSGKDFPVQPRDIGNVVVRLDNTAATFHFRLNGALIPINNGPTVATRLAVVGAYTHALGQYWAFRALLDEPRILSALTRRYPHIIVDEAQDVVSVHQGLLEVLMSAGTEVSLLGDPHQAIYEFAGANGNFLKEYAERSGVLACALTTNYRSVPTILAAANAISQRDDNPHRSSPAQTHGPYFIGYRDTELPHLVDAFCAATHAAGLRPENSAVVCRARSLANKLTGRDVSAGQGIVRHFATAAVKRDKFGDYHKAFRDVAAGVVALLKDPPKGLLAQIDQHGHDPETRLLVREIWAFTRDPEIGLPSATLTADSDWHPALVRRVKDLLTRIESQLGLLPIDNLGQKLSRKALRPVPLMDAADLAADQAQRITIDTVHHTKGASLEAVLYIAERGHARSLLNGVGDEIGRIGYVALTRAKNLFWLAMPENALEELRGELIAIGFQEVS